MKSSIKITSTLILTFSTLLLTFSFIYIIHETYSAAVSSTKQLTCVPALLDALKFIKYRDLLRVLGFF